MGPELDLDREMAELTARLPAAATGGGRLVMFVGALGGEGVSTVARAFALRAARREAQRTWLVDLDLPASPQEKAIAAAPTRFGPLGPPSSATPNGAVFFTVQPPLRRPDGRPWPDDRFIAGRAVGTLPLWVTSFRREALRPAQSVRPVAAGAYWRALKAHADLIVVDAPAARRSEAALLTAPFADHIVLVTAADEADVAAPAQLADALAAAGGKLSGLFLNRVQVGA
ncbi:MAG TPA: sugar kinase [Caulobacteraceae bacterium]|nr:sugar kinase [Caulobacteraceae bacterium]